MKIKIKHIALYVGLVVIGVLWITGCGGDGGGSGSDGGGGAGTQPVVASVQLGTPFYSSQYDPDPNVSGAVNGPLYNGSQGIFNITMDADQNWDKYLHVLLQVNVTGGDVSHYDWELLDWNKNSLGWDGRLNHWDEVIDIDPDNDIFKIRTDGNKNIFRLLDARATDNRNSTQIIKVTAWTDAGLHTTAYLTLSFSAPFPIPSGMVKAPSRYMDSTEVTKAQWDSVYNWAIANGYQFDNAGSGKAINHPVHTVNWYDCLKWCNARSEMGGRKPCYTVSGITYKRGQTSPACDDTGYGFRLPTSSEWEYAARGGLQGKLFPWGNTISHSQANYYSISASYDVSPTSGYHPDYYYGGEPYTSPVGSFPANGYGLYDMLGNVMELVNWYDGAATIGGFWGVVDETTLSRSWMISPDQAEIQSGFRTAIFR